MSEEKPKYKILTRASFYGWKELLVGLAVIAVIGLTIAALWVFVGARSAPTTGPTNSDLVNLFAKTLTEKNLAGNAALFIPDGSGRIYMNRLMQFLIGPNLLNVTEWTDQLEVFQAEFITNHMSFSNLNFTLVNANSLIINAVGYYTYTFDFGPTAINLPTVVASFSVVFNTRYSGNSWYLTYVEALPNATSTFIWYSSSGVEPPGPVLSKKKRSLPDSVTWEILVAQINTLYNSGQTQAALSICNTTQYLTLSAIFDPSRTNTSLVCNTQQQQTQLTVPLVCSADGVIDIGCLPIDALNITAVAGIQTINFINPTPVVKDFSISGGPGLSVSGLTNGISLDNLGILSIGLSVPTNEFLLLVGNVSSNSGTLSFTTQVQMPHTVWAGPASGPFSAQPTFRLLTEMDIPTLSLSTKVYGVLPVANGGTGSSATLFGNRMMRSGPGQTIVEALPLSPGQVYSVDSMGNLIPVNLLGDMRITIASLPNGDIQFNDVGPEVEWVQLQVPTDIFTITNGFVNSTGSLSFVSSPQLGNQVWASNPNGTIGVPAFRYLVVDDLPTIPVNKLSGILPISNGGTNSGTPLVNGRIIISQAGALVEGPALSTGQFLSSANIPTSLIGGNQISITNLPGQVTIDWIDLGVNLSGVVNGILGVSNGGTGVSSFSGNRILYSTPTSIQEFPALSDGQLLIGSTFLGLPQVGTIQAGSGASVTVGSGQITVAITGACLPNQLVSNTCIDISGETCSNPVDASCLPTALSLNSLNVGGTTSLGNSTICAAPLDSNCIDISNQQCPNGRIATTCLPLDNVYFNSAIIGTLTVLNGTQQVSTLNTTLLVVDDILLQKSMTCVNSSAISSSCIQWGAGQTCPLGPFDTSCIGTNLQLTTLDVTQTLTVGTSLVCSTPNVIESSCFSIDNKTCSIPLESSCIPTRIASLNGILPNLMNYDFTLLAGQGISINSGGNSLLFSNTGVLSTSLQVPADLFQSNSFSNGTLGFDTIPQMPHYLWIGPLSGGPSNPSFRPLNVSDLPALDAGKILIGTGTGNMEAYLTSGTGIDIMQGSEYIVISNLGLVNLTLTMPGALFDPTPQTTSGNSGNLAPNLAQQPPNYIFAGPALGGNSIPSFRAMVLADMPPLGPGQIYYGGTIANFTTVAQASLQIAIQVNNTAPDVIYIGVQFINHRIFTQTVGLVSQNPNLVLASPSGVGGQPYFRSLNSLDLPQETVLSANFPANVFQTSVLNQTLDVYFVNQTPNTFFAGPLAGSPGTPSFRPLGIADFAPLNVSQGYVLGGSSTGAVIPTILSAGSGIILDTATDGTITIISTTNASAYGTVTSVGLTLPTDIFTVSPSVITQYGTFVVSKTQQASNTVYAGPVANGTFADPTFRSLTFYDLPQLGTSQLWFGGPGVRTLMSGNGISITDNSVDLIFSVNLATIPPQNANLFYAGPSGGLAATPTFRSIQTVDLPPLGNGQLYIGNLGTPTVGSLIAGTGITVANGPGSITISANQLGTVTSVGLEAPSVLFNVFNSPITNSGDLILELKNQTASLFFASPTGIDGTPVFRAISLTDLPYPIPSSFLTESNITILLEGNGLSGTNGTIPLGGQISLSLSNSGVSAGAYTFANIVVDSYGRILNASSGTIVMPSAEFSVTVDNQVTWNTQNANYVFAGPVGGLPYTPSFRQLVIDDLPNNIPNNKLLFPYLYLANNSGAITGVGQFAVLGDTITLDLSYTGVVAGTYTLATITVDSQGRIINASNGVDIDTPGTVTSIALDLPASVFSISGSPVTTNGTLTGSFVFQAANSIFAGPDGVSGEPSFRTMVVNDLPNNIPNSKLQFDSITLNPGIALEGGGSVALGGSATISLSNTSVTPGTYYLATITVDQQGRITFAQGGNGNAGTVTDVGLLMPTDIFAVANSPVTSSGNLTVTFQNQFSNYVFAGPVNGTSGQPTFRYLQVADLPLGIPNVNLLYDTITVPVGTGLTGGGTAILGSSTVPIEIAPTGVINGTYMLPILTVNAQGQVTNIVSSSSGFINTVVVPSYMSENVSGIQLTLDFIPENANLVFAGPSAGSPANPGFRLLVPNDIPSLDVSKLTSGTLSVARGGTGLNSLFGNQIIASNPSGTNMEELGVMNNGQIIIGSTGSAPVIATISPTMFQTTVSVGPGTITVGTVQDISVVSDVKFNSLILAATGNQLTFGDITSVIVNAELPLTNASYGYTVPLVGGNGYFTMSTNRMIITGASPSVGQILQATSGTTSQWATPFEMIPQSANLIFAGPTTGSPVIPTFRSLVVADLPTGIPNANLLFSSITLNAGSGLVTTSSSISLGGSSTISLDVSGVSPGTYILSTITVDVYGRVTFAQNGTDIDNPGTVTSVGLQLPTSVFTIVNSTVTSAGDLIAIFNSQATNTVFAGPSSGLPGIPAFRGLVIADLPTNIPNSHLANSTVGILAGSGLLGGTSSLSLGSFTTLSLAPSGAVAGTYNLASITIDEYGRILNATSNTDIDNPGTVTSVDLLLPTSMFVTTSSPITSNGTLTAQFISQMPNKVFASPDGTTGIPSFRSLIAEDLPNSTVTPGTYNLATITVDQYGRITFAATGMDPDTPGTVTSVDLSLPTSVFSISGNPVTSNGTLTGSFISQAANLFFAAPDGVSGVPSFRSMVVNDLPNNIPNSKLLNSAVTITAGTGLANGGSVSLGGSVTISLENTAVTPGTYNFATITVDAQGRITSASSGSPGTVTSVALSTPSIFTVSGSPVTSAGTLSFSLNNQAQNAVFVGPTSGSGIPTFRLLVPADIPSLDATKITTGIFPVARGGTGVSSFATNQLILSDSTGSSLITLGAATNGQIPIGSTGSAPILATLTGTTNQVNVANGAGLITLSLPQNIHTGASPTFAALTLTSTSNQLTLGNIILTAPTAAGARTYTIPDTGSSTSSFLLTPNTVTIGNSPSVGFALIGTSSSAASWQTVVTSVSLALPASVFSISGSPVTSSGTLTGSFVTQLANTVFAGPDGISGTPTFRSMVVNDLPSNIPNSKLQNSAITVTAGTGLTGGGSVSLGGSTTLNIGNTGVTAGTYTIATITVNAQGQITSASSGSAGGTVSSVALSLPVSVFSVTGSPVTSAGTLTGSFVTQTANTVFAGPTTGVAATPAFRLLVAADIPNLDASKITTGILPIARGGTNSGTALNNNRIMVSSAGAIVEAAALTDGEILVGSTGAAPNPTTLTAGTGISITNGAGSVTISATFTSLTTIELTNTASTGAFTGTTFTVMASMQSAVLTGTYLVSFSTTCFMGASGTGNAFEISLFNGASQILHSVRPLIVGNNAQRNVMHTQAVITATGTQISLQWRRTAGGNSATCLQRSMILLQLS